jgi:hypothetical protein
MKYETINIMKNIKYKQLSASEELGGARIRRMRFALRQLFPEKNSGEKTVTARFPTAMGQRAGISRIFASVDRPGKPLVKPELSRKFPPPDRRRCSKGGRVFDTEQCRQA